MSMLQWAGCLQNITTNIKGKIYTLALVLQYGWYTYKISPQISKEIVINTWAWVLQYDFNFNLHIRIIWRPSVETFRLLSYQIYLQNVISWIWEYFNPFVIHNRLSCKIIPQFSLHFLWYSNLFMRVLTAWNTTNFKASRFRSRFRSAFHQH